MQIAEQGMLAASVTEEVQNAVFSIDGEKAPGLDGFPLLFYQKFWSLVKEDVILATQECFDLGRGSEYFNHTLPVLVPKKEETLELEEFRPISPLNGITS